VIARGLVSYSTCSSPFVRSTWTRTVHVRALALGSELVTTMPKKDETSKKRCGNDAHCDRCEPHLASSAAPFSRCLTQNRFQPIGRQRGILDETSPECLAIDLPQLGPAALEGGQVTKTADQPLGGKK
jgi:hypothetical protein